jgi:hypothetical protein
MGEEKIGSLQRVALREVWPHEAQDFTPWLAENIDVLNNAIDLSLSIIEREQAAGDFSVDLVAEDESGNPVIIENQLERSNHDHLGKLITYLTQIGAKAAIWIVSDPRPEHISAISWLNELSSASFYLLKLEAVRIEDSPPAPMLTLIVGSSEASQEAGETKREFTERHILRRRFWTSLLERAKESTPLHANTSPNQYNYVMTGAGKRGLSFLYIIQQYTSDIDLYIDRGRDTDNENEEIFDTLGNAKEEIEEVFGELLEWQRLEGKRACRIGKRFSLGGYRDDEEEWSEIQDTMIDGMIQLEKALRPHIDRLPT